MMITKTRLTRRFVVGIIAIVAVLGLGTGTALTLTPLRSAAQSPTASFQPFAATITYWSRDAQGRHPEGITQTIELRYTDETNWAITTTGNSAAPEFVGSNGSVNGDMSSAYDAMTKSTTTTTKPAGGGVSVPDRWIVPGIQAFLGKQGWTNTGVGAYEQVTGQSVESLQFDNQGRPLSYQITSAGVVKSRTTYQYR